jgi:DNA-binding NarL/FixJ family response regulator
MHRLLLVDDHACYREALTVALSAQPGLVVVGQASTCRQAVPLIESLQPDLTVMDLLLPDSDGISFARELRRRRLTSPLMLLTRVSSATFLEQALSAGLRGYSLKTDSLADLSLAVRLAISGGVHISPQLRSPHEPETSPLGTISGREREVLCLLTEGLTTKEVARRLFISPKTVDAHRARLNRKLGVRSPVELAHLVARQRLLG